MPPNISITLSDQKLHFTLSNANVSEGYVLDPQGKLLGKVTLPDLLRL